MRMKWMMVGWMMAAGSGLAASAQFEMQRSGTTASLRGIDAVSADVGWASGSDGTVLLTVDGGANWKRCATPKGAEKLDFRGVQGFDANAAVVMASGKGSLSAIYKTTDGCATWKMVFANPDKDGFFDALRKVTGKQMYLLGDPVGGKFAMFFSADSGSTWFIADDPGLEARKEDGAFAASNSALSAVGPYLFFGTGATSAEGPNVFRTRPKCGAAAGGACSVEWVAAALPLRPAAGSGGVFSVAARADANMRGVMRVIVVAVGGDYKTPGDGKNSAAWSGDGGEHWHAAAAGPGGYRSAVAWDERGRVWIAVGPSGADVSKDDGKNWTPVSGETAVGWNAISLPFVVGAKGAVGRLKAGASGK